LINYLTEYYCKDKGRLVGKFKFNVVSPIPKPTSVQRNWLVGV